VCGDSADEASVCEGREHVGHKDDTWWADVTAGRERVVQLRKGRNIKGNLVFFSCLMAYSE
jgi:hypothetical protein